MALHESAVKQEALSGGLIQRMTAVKPAILAIVLGVFILYGVGLRPTTAFCMTPLTTPATPSPSPAIKRPGNILPDKRRRPFWRRRFFL